MSKLDASRVNEIFRLCLSKDSTDPDGLVVEGVLSETMLNRAKLDEFRGEISGMLDELPDAFKANGGGGWSFLQACMDKHGNHWGEHPHMDELFQLGMGIGKVQCLLPRNLWKTLPGGMPYYMIH